jgi:hypothetical protein
MSWSERLAEVRQSQWFPVLQAAAGFAIGAALVAAVFDEEEDRAATDDTPRFQKAKDGLFVSYHTVRLSRTIFPASFVPTALIASVPTPLLLGFLAGGLALSWTKSDDLVVCVVSDTCPEPSPLYQK